MKDKIKFSKSELRGIAILGIVIISLLGYRYYLLHKNKKYTFEQGARYEKKVKTFEQQIDSLKQIQVTKTKSENKQDSITQNNKNYYKYFITKSKKQNHNKYEIKKININTATEKELEKIKVFPKVAKRIIKYRNRLGGFISVTQIKEVYGLSVKAYKWLLPHIYCKGKVEKININTVSFKNLLHHPYWNYANVKKVFKYKDKHGSIKDTITLKQILPDSIYQKVKYYVSF